MTVTGLIDFFIAHCLVTSHDCHKIMFGFVRSNKNSIKGKVLLPYINPWIQLPLISQLRVQNKTYSVYLD